MSFGIRNLEINNDFDKYSFVGVRDKRFKREWVEGSWR